MTEEGKIQSDIIKALKTLGALVFRLNSGRAKNNMRLCPKGTPDLLVIFNNLILWVEVKTPTGKLNDDQKIMHEKLKAKGQRVIVCRSVADLIAEIEMKE